MSGPGGGDTGAIRATVSEYYGKVLSGKEDLKTSVCASEGAAHPTIQKILERVPEAIKGKDYGCGAVPIPFGIEGLNVLDLGSGAGKDCYVAANLVGENGNVTGLDMTDEQLETSRKYADEYCAALGYKRTNLRFIKGYIEQLQEAGVEDESIDIATSNCVVNLSSNKTQVLAAIYKALKWGGELYFSDVYTDRRLPHTVKSDEEAWNE